MRSNFERVTMDGDETRGDDDDEALFSRAFRLTAPSCDLAQVAHQRFFLSSRRPKLGCFRLQSSHIFCAW